MATLATPVQPQLAQRNRAPAQLWLPRWQLSRCVRAVVSRSTLGIGRHWPPEWHDNHFPASPLCSISWFLAGHTELLEQGQAPRRLPRVAFSGPYTRPTHSRNSTEGHGFMLMLMPDALQALTGLDPARYLNRFVPLDEALDASWQQMAEAVLAAADDPARVALIEDFLTPRWQTLRREADHAHGLHLLRLQDWLQGLTLHAAASGVGRSLRQFERRIKGWTGLPMRELRGLGRAEQAFFRTLAEGDGPVRWAEVAADTGYADQSHLCRETRRVTGFSPQELRQRIAEDERFWIYRIWI